PVLGIGTGSAQARYRHAASAAVRRATAPVIITAVSSDRGDPRQPEHAGLHERALARFDVMPAARLDDRALAAVGPSGAPPARRRLRPPRLEIREPAGRQRPGRFPNLVPRSRWRACLAQPA